MIDTDKVIFFSYHFKDYYTSDFTIDTIGQKGHGLFGINYKIVPPFFILSSRLFKLWNVDKSKAAKILQLNIQKGIEILEKEQKLSFIVRSSAKFESFDDRGYYESSTGNLHAGDLYSSVLQIWEQNLKWIQKYPDNEFAVIVQQYIKPKYLGHLSNERRVSRNKNEWLLELVNGKGSFSEGLKFIAKSSSSKFVSDSFLCSRKPQLINALKKYAEDQLDRRHIEWVWDGSRVWLVQNDYEINVGKGSRPGHIWPRSKALIEKNNLECFHDVSNAAKNWRKIDCLRTFINCDLPHGQVYILEDPIIIQQLLNGETSQLLLKDLKWLLLYPITIRMDVDNADGYNNILLPRTETLFTVNEALAFLIKYSNQFVNNGLDCKNFCFLIHRFIISDSCALAFSKPHLQKARIDSTWGIVEGLYFHPHDSFEVNLMNSPPQIKKQIRCKTEYIDVDNKGKWFSKKSGTDFDWAESLTKKQCIDIASYNTKISEYLDSPVTVMYFVGVDQTTGYPEILPWFYTTDEITETSEKFTDVIFSENRFVIENEDDFNKIKSSRVVEEPTKLTIKLKLNPDISRDKKLIEDIGLFANTKSLPIELDGSILSHTYYILRKLNVRVKCLDAFEPKYKKQEFYKLVRDKIPVNIESKGEKARTIKIPSSDLLNFLKEKAIEEAFEFYFEQKEDNIIEELADIYEIIKATCKIFGTPIEEVIKIADKKNEKKGGFEAGVVLLNTEESSLIDVVDHSGRSLLTREKENKARGKVIKNKKISFGIDNSITLPYILNSKSKKHGDLSAAVNLHDIKSIKITYTVKGIKITFVPNQDSQSETNQLDLFA